MIGFSEHPFDILAQRNRHFVPDQTTLSWALHLGLIFLQIIDSSE